jgi:hypothetical protein
MRPVPPLPVWWVLWFALLSGPFVIFFVMTNVMRMKGIDVPVPWQVGLIPIAAGSIVRWTVLPKLKDGAAVFSAYIVGMALCESATFLGIFLFPTVRDSLFFLSIAGVAQFAPLFAKRFFIQQ